MVARIVVDSVGHEHSQVESVAQSILPGRASGGAAIAVLGRSVLDP
jgi:hypothetical protein